MTSSLNVPSDGDADTQDVHNPMSNLVHYFTPTLAHLIGLICKPEASSIPTSTSLLVIDGLSGLVNHAFPKNLEPRQVSKGSLG
jgi:hypothetical protein